MRIRLYSSDDAADGALELDADNLHLVNDDSYGPIENFSKEGFEPTLLVNVGSWAAIMIAPDGD